MATSSSTAGRHPILIGLLVLVLLLAVGGVIMYQRTDGGKALLPTLEKPSLTLATSPAKK
jgi:hypothetical protein